ncbi:hypothetical protein DSCO28_33730 [Desulfosarcina ovata subsp. sediminis]|uniref:DUF309 domain-containing protein n=2 Tax=Desulfosarcina ovata TaxID=83564 RepID=A0A5K7ZPV6_9BACT|nr:hypothetical protein DSCO28_33730 [Desulfosarcina ovata subsp. sediminis]
MPMVNQQTEQKTDADRFDPFNDRLSRDVRNALSVAFVDALERNELPPVHRIAEFFMDDALPEAIKAYIQARVKAYARVLADISDRHLDDPIDIAMAIWDRGLFFETHEFLEQYWLPATGEKKKLFQALIRAAGTYVHMEQGNLRSAGRIAAKAIHGLERTQALLAVHTDPKPLIDKLRQLDPVPPRLSAF